MKSVDLESKFKQAKTAGGGYLRVSAQHPVDLLVGEDEGRRSILLLCESEPKGLPVIDAVEVKSRLREDRRWALLVQLKRGELAGMFAYLATDLVESTLKASSGDSAVAALVERLKWWQRLLSKGRSAVLEEHILRGLVAELLFLVDCAIPEFGADVAVAGWVGPFEAPRDFKFDPIDVEVKAVRRDSTSVRITSLEQLDSSGTPLALAVLPLERVQKAQAGAFSVAELVNRVRDRCEPTQTAVEALKERLWSVGYLDLHDYADVWFLSHPFIFHECRPDFPRVVRKDVSSAIVGCTYDISLAAIESFRTGSWRSES